MKTIGTRSQNIGQIKRLTILIGTLLLLIVAVVKIYFLRQSFWITLIDSLFSLGIFILIFTATFYFADKWHQTLLQEIGARGDMATQLRLRSSALEAAANGIVITNRDGIIIWVNSAFTSLTGYEAAEVIGRTPRILRSEAHSPEFYNNMWKTILSGQPWHGEIMNRRKDGRLYAEEQTITPVLDESGQASHFVAIKLDVTQRKQAEADLREFAERLRVMHAIDQAVLARRPLEDMIQVALQYLHRVIPWMWAGVFMPDPNTDTAVSFTARYHQEAGLEVGRPFPLTLEEVENNAGRGEIGSVSEVDAGDGRSKLDQILQAVGVKAYVNLPLLLPQGTKTKGVILLGVEDPAMVAPKQLDITHEIVDSLAVAVLHTRLYDAERRQRERAEALQEMGAALSSTLDFDQVLGLVIDQIVRVISCDAANIILIHGNYARLVHSTGYDKYGAAVVSKVAGLAFEINNTPNLDHILKTKRPLIIDDVYTYPGWLHDKGVSHTRAWVGVPVFVEGEATAVFALSKTQPNYYNETHIDLLQAFAAQASLALENARLYEKLRAHAAQLEDRVAERTRRLAEANERLTELDRLKSKFISDISHELRTPITNMNMYLDLLERGKPEKHERYRQILKQETIRLTQLVESIFDESRQMGHLRQTQYAPVDLNHVVGEVLPVYEKQIADKQLALNVALDPELPLVFGERSQLARVITNLLLNAINYTPEGSITISTFSQSGDVHVQVEDTGVGIDKEDMPHLFERFYRGRYASQSTIPGVGLGLGVVQEIVGLHHGRINVSNRVTGGAVFNIAFPGKMPLPRD
ncbi:MAG: PAS domain S-box protein [Chloroflexi bacterium]|nr:PAS domain S-box protein [Chloroflexota bacterium]MBP7042284.1 PAS domain S-box protein [Chloroflexota bacterium]